MLTKEEVRPAMLRKLRASALSEKDLKLLRFDCFTAEQVIAKPALDVRQPAAGFVIPYYNAAGDYSDFFRFRYLEQPVRNGFSALAVHKELRYTQPGGLSPHVYFCPIFDWKDHLARTSPADKWMLITEGELKAACACKMGIPTLALGGVWNFMSKKEGKLLVDDLAGLALADWKLYVVFDSDAVTNPNVLMAENFLCQQLLNIEAHPYIIRLPALGKDGKTGLDDFLVDRGKAVFAKLMKNAEEWEPAQELHRLNEEVLFLRANCNVLEPHTRNRWRPSDFEQVFATRTYVVTKDKEEGDKKAKITTKQTAKEWLKWPGRAQVECVTYKPGAPLVVSDQYNMWLGWGLDEDVICKGNTKPWDQLMDYVFSAEDAPHRKWFEQWCAYPLQHPGAKLITAPVFWSVEQGTGKTLIAHTLARIYGENFSEIDSSMLNSPHNEWAQYKQFVLGDEITGEELGGKRKISIDTLKGLTTRQKLYLNPKFIGGYFIPDCINYIFTSNHPDAFRLEDRDRRFAIFEIKGAPLPKEFYKNYDGWYKSPAVGALFHKLLHIDLTGFDPYVEAPRTRAKRDMIEDARSDLGSWVSGLKNELRDTILAPHGARRLWTTSELYLRYDPNNKSRVVANGLSRELKRQGFSKALGGDVIATPVGGQKLWIISPVPPKTVKAAQFAAIYVAERQSEITYQEAVKKHEEKKKAL